MGILRKRHARAPGRRNNRELARAIDSTGLRDLEFVLVAIDVVFRESLVLTFLPVGGVREGKEFEAGLALRCIVGQTFPAIAAAAGFQVRLLPNAYTIALGDGVPMPAYWVGSEGAMSVGPLQVTHEHEGGRWQVSVEPVGFTPADAFDPRTALLREETLLQVATAFETRKGDRVRL